jgi:hypothetical protein
LTFLDHTFALKKISKKNKIKFGTYIKIILIIKISRKHNGSFLLLLLLLSLLFWIETGRSPKERNYKVSKMREEDNPKIIAPTLGGR